MVRMPLSPRTTASARRNRRDSPSFPSSRGHVRSVRSSWEPGALGGGKYSSSSSGYFDDDSENVDAYNTRSRLDAIKASHLRKPGPSPKRRFTPDRNSPTWRSVQRKSVFGDDYEEEEPTRKTLASETSSTERIRDASKAAEADATAKASLTSFVKSSKPKQTIASCPSSDSTASSLIYSLDETHNAGSSISETISAAAKMLEKVHESDEAEVPAKASTTEDKDDGMTLGTLTLSLSEESSGKKAEELVAATLAECRLMLAMSPPPTPVAKPGGRSTLAEEKRKLQEETRQSKEETKQFQAEAGQEQTPEKPAAPQAEKKVPEPASSLAGFLTCPTCAAGFQEDEIGRRPLHSFACDHIVCRKCVFDAACHSEGRMVACPECEAQGAFDTARPVVSRMYLSLVRRMNEELSSGEKEGEKEVVDGGKRQERQERQTVPTQICVDNTEDGDSLELTASASLTSLPKRPGAKGLRVDVASPTEFLAASHAPAVEEEKTGAKTDNVERSSKGISIGDKLAADATTSLVEPTTPVSRAEFRFRQRKEKLAQSLERVNKILERSKAVQEAGRAERSAYNNVTEGGKNETVSKEGPSRLRTELRVETGEIPAFSPIRSGKKAPNERAKQLQLSSGAKRRAHKAKATNKPREAAASVPPPVISPLAAAPEPPANANQQWGSLDIFRVDSAEDGPENGAPKTIEFGADFGSSPMSSCDAGDTLFLLADNRPRESHGGRPIQSKVKSYLAKGGPLSVERRPQRLSHGDKLQCPQFLPSLNYSTMQNEADGMAAGLVDPEERVPRSPMWGGGIPTAKSVGGLSFLSSPGGMRMRKPKSGGGSGNSMFRQMALSFDEMFRPSNNSPNDNVVFGRLESPACPGEEPDCPSYAFSVASCSMSPSSGDVGGFGARVEDGPLGALVTHKPRKLHKRILKRFMKKGRK
ncbi:hypothetical protein ACHAXT_002711 [Thalassiosira profunda]